MMASAVDQKSDSSICKKCLMRYDETNRIPKFLPCLHTFCQSCIKALIPAVDDKLMACPSCQIEFTYSCNLPFDKVFPTNDYAIEITNLKLINNGIKQEEEKPETTSLSSYWCLTCKFAAQVHCSSLDHTVIDLQEELEDYQKLRMEFVSTANAAVQKWLIVQECVQKKLLFYKEKIESSEQQLNQINEHLSCLLPFVKEGEEIKPLSHGTTTLRAMKSKLEATINVMTTELKSACEQHAKEVVEMSIFERSPVDVPLPEQSNQTLQLSPTLDCDNLIASPERKRPRLMSEDVPLDSSEATLHLHDNILPIESPLVQAHVKTIKSCFLELDSGEIVALAFNPAQPFLACLLNCEMVAYFKSENYDSTFSDWSSGVSDFKVDPKYSRNISWNVNGTHLAIWCKDTRDTNIPTMKKQSYSVSQVTIALLKEGELHNYTTFKVTNNSFSGGIHFLAWNSVHPNLLAVDCGLSVALVNIHQPQKIQHISIHSGFVTGLEWISANVFASCSKDGTIQIFDVDKNSLITTKSCSGGFVYSISWNPQVGLLASSSANKSIQLWRLMDNTATNVNLESGSACISWKLEDGVSNCLEWSSSEQHSNGPLLASCNSKGSVSIYETKTFKLLTPENIIQGAVTRLSFSPDGRYLFTAITDSTGHNIKIWNTITWEVAYSEPLESAISMDISWTFSSSKLAVINNKDQMTVLEF